MCVDHGFPMRIVYAAVLLAVSVSPALAQRVPAIVIPGKPGVPVLMNGVDVSGAVIDGDFGLDRPLAVTPTVIYRSFVIPLSADRPGNSAPGFFPKTGKRPGYGRLEIVPPPDRPLPPPAPTYYRDWSSQSAPGVVTDYPRFNVPPIMPRGGRSGREGQGGQEGREGAAPNTTHGRR